jgi:hypothetical protein
VGAVVISVGEFLEGGVVVEVECEMGSYMSVSGGLYINELYAIQCLKTSAACERVFNRAGRMHDDFKKGSSESTLIR